MYYTVGLWKRAVVAYGRDIPCDQFWWSLAVLHAQNDQPTQQEREKERERERERGRERERERERKRERGGEEEKERGREEERERGESKRKREGEKRSIWIKVTTNILCWKTTNNTQPTIPTVTVCTVGNTNFQHNSLTCSAIGSSEKSQASPNVSSSAAWIPFSCSVYCWINSS